jgi:hypothetical protein
MKILKIPAASSNPRQLSLSFDSKQLTALNVTDRGKIAVALAQILMQAAGLTVEELDDDGL